MKRMTLILAALLGMTCMSVTAEQTTNDIMPDVTVRNVTMAHEGSHLAVNMDIDLARLRVESNRAVLLTPRLVNGPDSLDLPSIGIYGRRRYYYYVRNGEGSISGPGERICKASETPDSIDYFNYVDWADWMDGATLMLYRSDWGCCNEMLAMYEESLGRHSEAFFPQLVFITPEAEMMKSRSLSGSAFIDFPVDRTEIDPQYRRNAAELGKIKATIDSVRGDNDISIVSVWLKGYASPESSYDHNRELAMGRTASLKNHIRQLYHFADGVIVTDYEPEDWTGLRRYVEQSNIDHRAEILALIDSDMEPDAKEWKIKRTYPDEYRFLLQNCYPALRHTDYRIDYNIRSYSDVDEIKRILAEKPGNLNLNELYILSRAYEPGSAEFTDVFETAVRMFPSDETANLNAANAAIRRDDFATARKYLDKAGKSAEAIYARGALAVREGDYETARRYLGEAKALGLEQAGITLDELNERHK